MIPVPLMALDISSYSIKEEQELLSWSSLRPYKVVTLRGLIGITEKLTKHEISFVESSSIQQALEMVKSKRAELAILPNVMVNADGYIATLNKELFTLNKIDNIEIFHFIHKKHAEIVPQLTLSIEKLITAQNQK